MEEKTKKLCGYIFFALVVVGLVLAIVGMFTGFFNAEIGGISESATLFDEGWDFLKAADIASPTFGMLAFIVTIVGCAVLLVDAILRLFVKKDLKIVRILGAVVTLVGAILILVAGIVTIGNINDAAKGMMNYSLGVGVFLGFIGGLVAAVAGALPLLKTFND